MQINNKSIRAPVLISLTAIEPSCVHLAFKSIRANVKSGKFISKKQIPSILHSVSRFIVPEKSRRLLFHELFYKELFMHSAQTSSSNSFLLINVYAFVIALRGRIWGIRWSKVAQTCICLFPLKSSNALFVGFA